MIGQPRQRPARQCDPLAIGTGTGQSGLALFAGMQPDGILTSVDLEADHQRQARKAFSSLGIPNQRFRLIAGDALTVLPKLSDGAYDLVSALEVIEHVADPATFAAGLARVLAPGGVLILSTPNRTALSRTAIVTLAEGFGRIPRGTHDADRFITPDEMRALLGAVGLEIVDTTGLAWSPTRDFTLSEDLRLDYLMTARLR